MQVIGAGFGRTGTMSLKVALEELGAGPCLHSLESLGNGEKGERGESTTHWERLVRGEEIDWREALKGFGSTVDWLCARYYPEILAAWPEAKVILSVRDPQDWYDSCFESLHATRGLVGSEGIADGQAAVLQAVDSAIWEDVFGGRFPERDYALEVFERHRREVSERVPADRLLVYDIQDGWRPLCELLDAPVPQTPFPHLNSRASFWTRFGMTPGFAGLGPEGTNGGAHGARSGAHAPGNGNGSSTGDPRSASSSSGPRHAVSPLAQAPMSIAGLTLADPPASLDQRAVLDLLGLSGDEFAERIFSRCGVERRRMYLDEKLLSGSLQDRTPYVEERLMADAVRAVEQLGVDPAEIGTIVSATLYSLGCPTLGHRLIEHFDMDRSTDKYHLVGVGCASAVPLVRLAGQALQGHPGKKALVVAAESMSGLLCTATEQDMRAKTVGSAIFGDGCAAMLLDGGQDAGAAGPHVIASRVHQIPGTIDAVRLDFPLADSYLGLVRELPDVAGAHARGLVDGFLQDCHMTGHMIDHWIIHPGGRRIIECVQEALELREDEVRISHEVLAEHGNVGTPAIFYVLAETIAQRNPRPGQHGLLLTIGPGVSVGLMLVRF
ncbi:MAG: sulfotransferase [Solirubrobacteraceae bacterium]